MKKKYCLVCLKKLPDSESGYICAYTKHFANSSEVIKFYNSVLKKFGLVFALETKTMCEYYHKDLKKLYKGAVSTKIVKKEVEID